MSLGTTREDPPDSLFDDHPTGVRPGFIFTSGTDLGITAPVPRVPVCNDAGFHIFQFSKLQPLKANRCTQPLAERGNLLNSRISDGIRKLADANSSVELVVRSTNATWVAFPDYYTRRRPSTPSSPSSSFFALGIWLVAQRYKTIRDRAVLFYWPAPPIRVTPVRIQPFPERLVFIHRKLIQITNPNTSKTLPSMLISPTLHFCRMAPGETGNTSPPTIPLLDFT